MQDFSDECTRYLIAYIGLDTKWRGGAACEAAKSHLNQQIRSKLIYTQKVVQSSTSLGTSMPKLKTHSGAAKRFKKTGTGKFKRGQSKMRHILTSKATKTKKKLGRIVLVSEADTAKVARMLPYA